MMQLISRLGMCVILLAAFGVASACLSISVSHASDVSYGVEGTTLWRFDEFGKAPLAGGWNFLEFTGVGNGEAIGLDLGGAGGKVYHFDVSGGTQVGGTFSLGFSHFKSGGDGVAYGVENGVVYRFDSVGQSVAGSTFTFSEFEGVGFGEAIGVESGNVYHFGASGQTNLGGGHTFLDFTSAGHGVAYGNDNGFVYRIDKSGKANIGNNFPSGFDHFVGGGTGEAYGVEGTSLYRFDASGQTFIPGGWNFDHFVSGGNGDAFGVDNGLVYHFDSSGSTVVGSTFPVFTEFLSGGGGVSWGLEGNTLYRFDASGQTAIFGVNVTGSLRSGGNGDVFNVDNGFVYHNDASGKTNIGGTFAAGLTPWVGGGSLLPATFDWVGTSSGDWDYNGNWSPGSVPNDNTRSVVFGSAITSAASAFTNTVVTVKGIQFDNANTYVVVGAGSVTLEADTGSASVDVLQGSHQLQAAVNLNSVTDVSVAAGATLTFHGALSNGGNNLNKTGDGTLQINNALNSGAGTLSASAGIVSGVGMISGDLDNTAATVAPGNSAGTLSVGGNYTQGTGGTLAIELAGTAAGEFDVLDITGSATLDGILDISLLSFSPNSGDTFDILTASSITDNVLTLTGDTSGFSYSLESSSTVLRLTFTGVNADFDSDGNVDGVDFLTWQRGFNAAGTLATGDANGDLFVDAADLTIWENQYGSVTPLLGSQASAAAVPEPSTFGLMGIALIGFLFLKESPTMKTRVRFDDGLVAAITLKGALTVLILGVAAQASIAAWDPYYVKQGDGAGGVVYRSAQIQVVGKPPLSPLGDVTTGFRPFGMVEILDNFGVPSGTIAMTGGMPTVNTGGEPVITFSTDGGDTWSAFQSSGGVGLLTDHGGGNLSAEAGGGSLKSFSSDLGQTWSVPSAVPNTATGFPWATEGNTGVDRDGSGNATKIMEIGYGSGEASFPGGAFTGYYRETVDGGTTWTGAGGVGAETNPGTAWKFNSLDGNSTPVLRGVSEGSVVRADNGDLVAALRTDLPAVYFDGLGGPNFATDALEGTAISISSDNGATWSALDILYDAGRHHGNLQKLPSGDLALTMIVRNDVRGSVGGTSADLTTAMRGADMLISDDHGATWNLNERVTLHQVEHLDADPSKWHDGDVGHLATAVLGDGSLLTAYTNNTIDNNNPAAVLVKWDPSTATVLPVMDWGKNASGDWNSSSNWKSSLAPQDKKSTALFGTAINSAQTVLTDSAITVRGVEFSNTNTYAIAGLGSVELDGDTGDANVTVFQGSHQFQVVVNLATNTQVDVASGAVLAFNNVLNLNGNDLTKIGSGTVQYNNVVNLGGGTIFPVAGSIAGSGTIQGDVVNSGATVAPGNSPGTLTIQGNYTQEADATLAIELAGLTQGSDYDLLDVSGIATLNGGSLDVTLLDGFNPAEGDVFDILDASAISGAGFDSIGLPALAAGLAWDTSGLMSGGSLAVSAVPEPSAIVLILAGTLCASGMAHRKRRR